MSAHPPTDRPVGWTRFAHGSFECTVVSDGIIRLGPARESFPNAEPAQVDALLTAHYLPTDAVHLNQNVLVVDTGDHLVMFDTGVGTDPDLGRKEFGDRTGMTIPNLRDAGIRPEDIDLIVLTHAHPDHGWGLADAEGGRLYPRARVAVGEADYRHWTDLSHVDQAPTEHVKDQFRGAHKNLLAYENDLILLTGDVEVVPGVRAMATPGHSPGHTVYAVTSGEHTMIVWGDLCHHQVLLLQRPDWNFVYDHDGARATAQRRRLYDLVHSRRWSVLGYHFPFPGLGHLRPEGDGYAWLPADLELRLPVTRG